MTNNKGNFISGDRGFPLPIIVAILVVLIILLIGGGFFHRSHKERAYKAVQDALTSVGKLKSNQIADWRRKLIGNATLIAQSPFMANAMVKLLSAPHREMSELIKGRLLSIKENFHYDDMLVVDLEGNVRFSLSGEMQLHKPCFLDVCSKLKNASGPITQEE